MRTIYLSPEQVPAYLRQGYKGNSFKAYVCESVTIPADAGLWSGGTRETYSLVRLSDGARLEAINHNAAPWDLRVDTHVTLEPGIAVVCHSLFCGRDTGLTFYMLPSDATPMLPPSDTLSGYELAVLNIIGSYISRARAEEYARAGITDPEAIKASLIAGGYLTKAGGITVKGRNARA